MQLGGDCMTNKEFLSVVEFLFCIAEPIINVLDPPKKTGRPRVPTRDAFEVILRKFYTGIQWRMIDDETSKVKGSTAHNIFQKWTDLGIFNLLYAITCRVFNEKVGFDFSWQSVDATKCQAPVRNIGYDNEALGHNPTDRGFKGTKISAQFDANGYPIGFVISGANVHDMKLLENTIIEARKKAIYLAKENNIKMNLCLDKGYYGAPAEIIAFIYGYESHIQSRGEEKKKDRRSQGQAMGC